MLSIWLYLPVPVEYKRGRPKRNDSDLSQLVAQILCLEEMLCCEISKGYLFYEEIKRREEVIVTDEDRERVREAFREMRMYFERNHTPKAKTGPHCQSCSLNQICLPEMLSKKSVSRFIESRLNE
ncbi:CRISPR-associated protein Cas4 [Paenibacillus macerans]|uniref:CRISPR-associated protein Cas4 n=1 Tax=Paenibacillus macerans TaxID=44252 RepID=UPI002E1A2C6F